jgi:hypothetical protein
MNASIEPKVKVNFDVLSKEALHAMVTDLYARVTALEAAHYQWEPPANGKGVCLALGTTMYGPEEAEILSEDRAYFPHGLRGLPSARHFTHFPNQSPKNCVGGVMGEVLISDGVHIPEFHADFHKAHDSDEWQNEKGKAHLVMFWWDGSKALYRISKYEGEEV